MTLAKCAFLDRDGVLVEAFPEGRSTRGPRTLDEVKFLPGVQEACDMLRDAGYKTAIITNQPDVSRGRMTKYLAEQINSWVMHSLAIDAFYVCPHDNGHCSCRKPAPGLLYAAAYEMNLCLADSIMFGDRPTDEQAAIAAGVRFIGVPTNHGLLECVTCLLNT